ncbi:hypothetical protein HDR62_03065 [bacterium]|nr:hypothetical protein [bacterium]
MKAVKIIFFCVIVGFVLLAVFTTNTNPEAVSSIDNRRLVKWKGDINPYFQDRLGFRDKMIDWYTVYNDRIFNEMVHPIYEYGKDGYVFFKFRKENYDEEFINLFCRYIRQVQDYCMQRGVKFVYSRNPSKPSVYTQYVASGYQYFSRFHSLMTEWLDFYGVHYVDQTPLLREISKTEQVFNRQYDAGHWNDVGAFYATNHLLEEMAKDFPCIRMHDLSDFNVETEFQKSLPVSLFVINENVPHYTLRHDLAKHISHEYSGLKLHKTHPVWEVYQTENEECPNVLFFGSSYYNTRNRFYHDRFYRVAAIHCYQNFLNFDYYFNIFKPDYVVLETGEYAVNAGYFSKETLQNKILNPPYDSVEEKTHERLKLADLKDYREEDQEKLVRVSFSVPEDKAFGYLFVGKTEYDLQLDGATAEVTLLKTEYDKDAVSVALFPAR